MVCLKKETVNELKNVRQWKKLVFDSGIYVVYFQFFLTV